ncbi:unnamed protein product [Durusdinium trenchii]|uniref:Uncharacterized protein n=1 Tax=Durusdinium trenchii TaxID=1381693 RepID=A0ABP0HMV9_9DINO
MPLRTWHLFRASSATAVAAGHTMELTASEPSPAATPWALICQALIKALTRNESELDLHIDLEENCLGVDGAKELAKDLESMGTLQLYVHNNEIGKEGVEALEEVQARRRASGQTNFKVQELGVQQLEEEKFEEKPRKHRKKRRILFVGKKKCGQTSAEIESGEREVA